MNAKKGISYSFLHLDIPLTTYFSEIWGMPVFIENDTHLLALGENYYGIAKDLTNVITVNLSKGLAVSIISNGFLQTGHIAQHPNVFRYAACRKSISHQLLCRILNLN